MVVVPLKRTSGTVKNLKNPDEMDMEEVGSLNSEQAPSKPQRHLRLSSFFLGWQKLWVLKEGFQRHMFVLPAVACARQIDVYTHVHNGVVSTSQLC